MMTIGKIQGLAVAGFGVTRSPMVHDDPQTRSAQEHPTERLPMADALEDTARPARPEPGTGAPFEDPKQMQDFRRRVADAIDKASIDPHLVGFHTDPETRDIVIEIRRPDGTLITRFLPENVLNLERIADDLSGMLIDQRT